MTKTNKRAAFISATSSGVFCRVPINPKKSPAARNLAMLENVREKASKDPWYLKESENCVREGYF